MKHLLLTTVAAVVLVGCGPSEPPDISIHQAANDGNIAAVKQRLADDVNAKNGEGMTPLHYAAYKGHKEMAELLIAKGADVNAKGFFGMTPLNMANDEGEKEMADLLRKHGGKTAKELKAEGKISIHEAAEDGNIEAVKQHLAAGADVNAKDGWGYTPLHNAADGGHMEITELLIDKGAEVNAKEEDTGKTPLHYAHNKEIAELLISKGADVNGTGDLGLTVLHNAAAAGHKEITQLLIAKGADVNAKNPSGRTPLDFVSNIKINNRDEIADLLRKHGGKTGDELKAELK